MAPPLRRRLRRAIAADRTLTEIPLPDPEARPHATVADASANGGWITLWGTSRVAHVNMDGEVTEFDLPLESEPHGLTLAADGTLWTALESGHLARLSTAALTLPQPNDR